MLNDVYDVQTGEEDWRSPDQPGLQGLADLQTAILGNSHSHRTLQQL